MTDALLPTQTLRFAVVSPYGTLRGIYECIDTHEGRPAFVRVMADGMDPSATTCIFFSSVFGKGARWYFGTSLPKWSSTGGSMRSFCISLEEDSSVIHSPEQAQWPSEDVFEMREATEEDDANMYFFPKGPSGPRPEGFHPSNAQIGESMQDNLEVLGLSKGGLPSLDIVRGSYRKRALALHPDKGGTKEQFQVLQNAYEAVIEALIRCGRGPRSKSAKYEDPVGGGRQEETPDEPDINEGTEVSEAEKHLRRQRALEAALRRQGQTP